MKIKADDIIEGKKDAAEEKALSEKGDSSLKENLDEKEIKQRLNQRKWAYITVIFSYIAWTIFVGYIVYKSGLQDNKFSISNYVLIAMIAPLAIVSLGSLFAIIVNLFPGMRVKKSKE